MLTNSEKELFNNIEREQSEVIFKTLADKRRLQLADEAMQGVEPKLKQKFLTIFETLNNKDQVSEKQLKAIGYENVLRTYLVRNNWYFNSTKNCWIAPKSQYYPENKDEPDKEKEETKRTKEQLWEYEKRAVYLNNDELINPNRYRKEVYVPRERGYKIVTDLSQSERIIPFVKLISDYDKIPYKPKEKPDKKQFRKLMLNKEDNEEETKE